MSTLDYTVNGMLYELTPSKGFFVLIVTFGGLAGSTNIVSGTSECSCWCIPELGNVLPYAIPRDQVSLVNAYYTPLVHHCMCAPLLQPTVEYVWHVTKLVVAFGILLFLNYLTVSRIHVNVFLTVFILLP